MVLFGATAGQAVVWYGGHFYALIFLTQTLKVSLSILMDFLEISVFTVRLIFNLMLKRKLSAHGTQLRAADMN